MYNHETYVNNLNSLFISNIKDAAYHANMLNINKINQNNLYSNSKPWFTKECSEKKKKQFKHLLKKYHNTYSEEDLVYYLTLRKSYLKTYNKNIQNNISDTSNNIEF